MDTNTFTYAKVFFDWAHSDDSTVKISIVDPIHARVMSFVVDWEDVEEEEIT